MYLPMQASLLLVANPTISPAGKFLERNYYWLEIMARLRPGATLAQAQATLALPFEEIVDRQLSTPAQSTTLMSAFALLALLLASLGLYGVLSYAVTQRTNEIGVRMALGATSREILLSFGKHGLALTLTGLAVGLVLAAIAARLMTALLYGFRPDYIPTVTVVSLILLAVATLAWFVPARRASRVDPMIALRNE